MYSMCKCKFIEKGFVVCVRICTVHIMCVRYVCVICNPAFDRPRNNTNYYAHPLCTYVRVQDPYTTQHLLVYRSIITLSITTNEAIEGGPNKISQNASCPTQPYVHTPNYGHFYFRTDNPLIEHFFICFCKKTACTVSYFLYSFSVLCFDERVKLRLLPLAVQ